MTGDLIFVLLAALTVIPTGWIVLSRNIVHAGFALLFTLLGVAGLYAYMGADFIAVTQLMVYIGGVLVLILFTVMMTRVPQATRKRHGLDRYVPAALFSLIVFALLYMVVTRHDWGWQKLAAEPTTAVIGTNFMTNYIFPFEYVSLVLLAAMIGAAILVRERREEVSAEEPAAGTEQPAAEGAEASDQEVQQ